MEQQKILWVIFSVTLFLLVVVVAGFVWFVPSEDQTADDPQVVSETHNSATILDPIVWVRDDGEVPGLQDEPENEFGESEANDDLLLVYGEADESESNDDVGTVGPGKLANNIEEVENRLAVESKRVATEATAERHADPQPTRAPVRTRAPDTAEPTPISQPKTVRVTQYWIQAASYRSQSRAEETRDNLSQKGWDGRIVTRDVGGELYYRVRLGPYQTEAEAGKFLSWIRDIKSFEASYISQVYASRTIN